MSYPPPPGLKPPQASSSSTSTSSPQPHASLPPRPPPPAGPPPSFKQAFNNVPNFSSGAPGTRNYDGQKPGTPNGQAPTGFGGFAGFQPRSVSANTQPFRAQNPVVSAPPAPPTGFSAPQTSYGNGAFQPQPSYQQPPTPSYYPPSEQQPYAEPTPPQIRNPFPLPGQASTGGAGRGFGNSQEIDPEMEAQIAQWQSAYASKDSESSASRSNTAPRSFTNNNNRSDNSNNTGGPGTAANSAPLGVRQPDVSASTNAAHAGPTMSSSAISSAAAPSTATASIVTDSTGKSKTVVRSGGGQTWQDHSLLEWDPAHFRLFVGNLAGEVTDESLLKAFIKYPSVQKARVVRDKRTTKSKGYGFVSFADGDEYFRAARDMQGKYIGSHPVLLRKSNTEIKPTAVKGKGKGGKGGKGGGGGGAGGGGVGGGGGVQKKQGKIKGGLKVLG
ncbi:MAG: hypothetical protein Q9220_000667 [cf. Caloplaca sp. 1 TL-2023]